METAVTIHSGRLPAGCQNPNATALRYGAPTLHACWDGEGRMTALGGIVYFAEYLREAGFLDLLLRGSPLCYKSPNAPDPADVMATFLVAVLAGLDNTVKCLYGHQEGAEKGYNPKKPAAPATTTRPSSSGAFV